MIITDTAGELKLAMNANAFLRAALSHSKKPRPADYCHRPIIVKDGNTLLGKVMPGFSIGRGNVPDSIHVSSVVLLWNKEQRIISGTDILR